MRDELAHRGPDEAGVYVDGQISLGHRRLSVIDLENGQQPFQSDDGSVVLVFNGEIYNHPELRMRLQDRGARYRTNSDTESIIHAYKEYGLDCVQHLDGMFAFVIYDKRNNLLFGARDRFGKKPFYYSMRRTKREPTFVFASELKSLVKHRLVQSDLSLSMDGLVSYLLHDYVAGPKCIYDGVERLEAGHAFCLDLASDKTNALRRWRYWNNPIHDRPFTNVSEQEAIERCSALLGRSIERRLMSDVPLGVFLSGGLDSSAIVAFLATMMPASDIQTFSIGFNDKSFDESEYSSFAANYYGTDHHSKQFTAVDCINELENVIEYMDEPLADPSILPVSMLCEFARQRVTVALSGDGGDELFAGYDPFSALSTADTYDRVIPEWFHAGVVQPLASLLPASADNLALGFRVSRFLRGAKKSPSLRLATWMGPFSQSQLNRLVPDVADRAGSTDSLEAERQLYTQLKQIDADRIQAASAYYQNFYLPDNILVKVDRASMMHSLEVRAPFLDTELAEYVNRLPSNLKLRHGSKKFLLKKMLLKDGNVNPHVPPSIVNRKKKGFGIPVARWIRDDLRSDFREGLIDQWPDSLDMFDRQEISNLYKAHIDNKENNYKELWALFILSQWARQVEI